MNDLRSVIREARLEADLTQAELAVRAGSSQPAIARYETGQALPSLPTLERLLSACGRQLQVRSITTRRGAASSVRGLPGQRASQLRRTRRRLLEAAGQRGARNVRVFGSLARGEGTDSSDIDLLVELEPGRTLLDLAGLRREAEQILGTPVDVVTPDLLKPRIRREILREALPL